MNTIYISPLFKNADGSPRKCWVPLLALDTYERRDAAILQLKALGGIHAPANDQTRKLHNIIRNARNKIDREMWFSRPAE